MFPTVGPAPMSMYMKLLPTADVTVPEEQLTTRPSRVSATGTTVPRILATMFVASETTKEAADVVVAAPVAFMLVMFPFVPVVSVVPTVISSMIPIKSRFVAAEFANEKVIVPDVAFVNLR
jgi:hypothetical protein